MCRQ
jgi:hypothetical protein